MCFAINFHEVHGCAIAADFPGRRRELCASLGDLLLVCAGLRFCKVRLNPRGLQVCRLWCVAVANLRGAPCGGFILWNVQ